MLPMHRTEALWLSFSARSPMALKVGVGGVCAISGERWSPVLKAVPQNFVVLPNQPWLDGFRIAEGIIRQFVAVPMGKDLSVEKQITGAETWGGLQLQAMPMRLEEYWEQGVKAQLEETWARFLRWPRSFGRPFETIACSGGMDDIGEAGLGAGGRIAQRITSDPYGLTVWDTNHSSRCYVRLCLAEDWQRLTGQSPPHLPPTALNYTKAGLPWFDYQNETPAVVGTTPLAGVKSLNTLIEEKVGLGLSGNGPLGPLKVVTLKGIPSQ